MICEEERIQKYIMTLEIHHPGYLVNGLNLISLLVIFYVDYVAIGNL